MKSQLCTKGDKLLEGGNSLTHEGHILPGAVLIGASLSKSHISDRARAVGGSVDSAVVEKHRISVLGKGNVALNVLEACKVCVAICAKGILGSKAAVSAVSDRAYSLLALSYGSAVFCKLITLNLEHIVDDGKIICSESTVIKLCHGENKECTVDL